MSHSTLASVASSPLSAASGLAPIVPQLNPMNQLNPLNPTFLVPHMQSLSLHQVSSAPSTPAMQHSHIMSPMLAAPHDSFMQLSFPHNPHDPLMYQGHPPAHFHMGSPQSFMPMMATNFSMPPQLQSPEYWVPQHLPPVYTNNFPMYPPHHNMHTPPTPRAYDGRPRGMSFNQRRNPDGSFMSPQAYEPSPRRRGTYSGANRAANLDQSYRLFIGNIPYSTQWQELKDFLRKAGEISRVEIPENSDGRAKGFAIATYQSRETASAAIAQFNGVEFQGRELTVRFDKYNNAAAPAAAQVQPAPPAPQQQQLGRNAYYSNSGYSSSSPSRLPSMDVGPPPPST